MRLNNKSVILLLVSQQNEDKNKDVTEGIVSETLPNALFRIEIKGTDEPQLAYLAGKMRMHRIKVLVGDTVLLKIDPYGGRARIVRRL